VFSFSENASFIALHIFIYLSIYLFYTAGILRPQAILQIFGLMGNITLSGFYTPRWHSLLVF
jgi:hypothetical protein